MSGTLTNSIKSNSSNPVLDELFGTETQGLEPVEYEQITEGELAEFAEKPPEEKDEEDKEIDAKIDTVYTAAIDAFNQQTAYTEIIEPRYAARNAEVAANYLNIALNAAATRAKVKGERKRQAAFVPFSGARNPSNVVVASREDIMNMISIDADVKELK